MRLIFLLFSLFLVGCQQAGYESFRAEGRASTRELIVELKKIRTRDQLIASESRIQTRLKRIQELVAKADAYQRENPDLLVPDLEPIDHELSDALKLELTRVMRLEGGQEVLKRALNQ
jgi:hypothetical protein